MERIVTDCDKCKKKALPTRQFQVPFGTQIDPPSGRTETIDKRADLCLECMAQILKLLWFGSMTEVEGKVIAAEWGLK